MSYAFMAEPPPPRRRSPITFGRLLIVIGIGLVVALVWMMSSRITVSDRPNELKTTRVLLPPPPPPPPPPPETVQETPPEPVPTPVPLDQPLDTPPSNYGLVGGDGSGGRIGGRPGGGGNGFGAYGELTRASIHRAIQADEGLQRGQYTVRLTVTVDEAGRITLVRIRSGTGDARRDARLVQVLTGLQLSERPPAGLPVMNIELNARSGRR